MASDDPSFPGSPFRDAAEPTPSPDAPAGPAGWPPAPSPAPTGDWAEAARQRMGSSADWSWRGSTDEPAIPRFEPAPTQPVSTPPVSGDGARRPRRGGTRTVLAAAVLSAVLASGASTESAPSPSRAAWSVIQSTPAPSIREA